MSVVSSDSSALWGSGLSCSSGSDWYKSICVRNGWAWKLRGSFSSAYNTSKVVVSQDASYLVANTFTLGWGSSSPSVIKPDLHSTRAGIGHHGVMGINNPIASATNAVLSSLPKGMTQVMYVTWFSLKRCCVMLSCFGHVCASSFRQSKSDDV